ncbi:MAG: 4Fe-4S dicluster domain-containing protein [Phycisphaerae bacterium]|nr:4Fe-4S dicluster domain-containing protein [Phycisphaerae bacterium]
MLDRIITHAEVLRIVADLAPEHRIVGPVLRGGQYFYEILTDLSGLDLTFSYCVYGPRAFLFPPTETLFQFSRQNGRFESTLSIERVPTAFVGVHPCDINAIRLLDRVFSKDHRDEHYLSRRECAFIIGVDCAKECTVGVFCADMHGNVAKDGFDLMLFPLEQGSGPNDMRYGLVFGSKRGEVRLQKGSIGAIPKAADERAMEEYQRRKEAAFPHRLKTRLEELPSLLNRSYDSLLWEATARRCYSCGSCNMACPTCYCFNIFDETDMTLTRGERKREWDGCQLEKFAEVAGPHNFRPKAASRLRHRIFRKAKWVKDQSGIAGCVGCARCDRACTAKINSVEIYNQLAEEI